MAVGMGRGLSYQIPSRVHAGTRLSPEDRARFRAAF
jgi:hypothetical protein